LAAVRIFIVDDCQAWRSAVCSMLQEQLDSVLVCEGSDGLEAVRKSEELQPDLILLDIGLPTLDGLEAARRIRKVSPQSRILFLTSHNSPELLKEALDIGALGFVVKSNAGCDLLPAVRAVMQDKQFFESGF